MTKGFYGYLKSGPASLMPSALSHQGFGSLTDVASPFTEHGAGFQCLTECTAAKAEGKLWRADAASSLFYGPHH